MNINRFYSPLMRKSLTFGIDKLSLSTRDFKVDDYLKFDGRGMRRAGLENPEIVFHDAKKQPVREQLYKQTAYATYDVSKKGLRILFNPSGKTSLVDDPQEVKQYLDIIRHDAKDLGLTFSDIDLKVTRIDLAKDSEMEMGVKAYKEAFKWSKGKRMNKKEYPDGYLMGNTYIQSCFYDRGKKLRKDGYESPEGNLMRGEARILKRKKMQAYLGIYRMDDLYKYESTDLKEQYVKIMNDTCFRSLRPSTGEHFDNIYSVFKYAHDTWKRGFLFKALAMLQGDDPLDGISDDTLREILVNVGISPKHTYKMIEQIREVQNSKQLIQVDSYRMVEELRQKFIA